MKQKDLYKGDHILEDILNHWFPKVGDGLPFGHAEQIRWVRQGKFISRAVFFSSLGNYMQSSMIIAICTAIGKIQIFFIQTVISNRVISDILQVCE